jgi:hypothetical protein
MCGTVLLVETDDTFVFRLGEKGRSKGRAQEFTCSMLRSHDGRVAELLLTEIELSQIPAGRESLDF